jgi:hypothetical protein
VIGLMPSCIVMFGTPVRADQIGRHARASRCSSISAARGPSLPAA